MTDKPKKRTCQLGFAVKRGQIVNNNGSVRPATDREIDLWKELLTYRPDIAVSAEEAKEQEMQQAVSDALESTSAEA